MGKLAIILGVSLGSLFLGYAVRILLRRATDFGPIENASKNLKLIATFVLNPIPIFDSFWRLPLSFRGLAVFPVLGLLSLAVGATAAIVANRLFRIPPRRAASVFVSGMFTNIISFGGLISFVFFGYRGYGLVQLFNMLLSFAYYGFGFPISERVGRGESRPLALSPRMMFARPYVYVPVASIGAGLVLNVLHVAPVAPLGSLSSFLIPFVAGLMGFSIGITMRFGKIGRYRREIVLISLIKFLIVPAVIVPFGLALGLAETMGGLPFKVLVVMSFMPVAFNALVPPALYGFDLDLANSAWIITTLALFVIVPGLYLVLGV